MTADTMVESSPSRPASRAGHPLDYQTELDIAKRRVQDFEAREHSLHHTKLYKDYQNFQTLSTSINNSIKSLKNPSPSSSPSRHINPFASPVTHNSVLRHHTQLKPNTEWMGTTATGTAFDDDLWSGGGNIPRPKTADMLKDLKILEERDTESIFPPRPSTQQSAYSGLSGTTATTTASSVNAPTDKQTTRRHPSNSFVHVNGWTPSGYEGHSIPSTIPGGGGTPLMHTNNNNNGHVSPASHVVSGSPIKPGGHHHHLDHGHPLYTSSAHHSYDVAALYAHTNNTFHYGTKGSPNNSTTPTTTTRPLGRTHTTPTLSSNIRMHPNYHHASMFGVDDDPEGGGGGEAVGMYGNRSLHPSIVTTTPEGASIGAAVTPQQQQRHHYQNGVSTAEEEEGGTELPIYYSSRPNSRNSNTTPIARTLFPQQQQQQQQQQHPQPLSTTQSHGNTNRVTQQQQVLRQIPPDEEHVQPQQQQPHYMFEGSPLLAAVPQQQQQAAPLQKPRSNVNGQSPPRKGSKDKRDTPVAVLKRQLTEQNGWGVGGAAGSGIGGGGGNSHHHAPVVSRDDKVECSECQHIYFPGFTVCPKCLCEDRRPLTTNSTKAASPNTLSGKGNNGSKGPISISCSGSLSLSPTTTPPSLWTAHQFNTNSTSPTTAPYYSSTDPALTVTPLTRSHHHQSADPSTKKENGHKQQQHHHASMTSPSSAIYSGMGTFWNSNSKEPLRPFTAPASLLFPDTDPDALQQNNLRPLTGTPTKPHKQNGGGVMLLPSMGPLKLQKI